MSAGDLKLVPLRIRLPYTSEAEFVERYGANVARGGVFISTRAAKAEGTGISFEFVLKDGSRLLRGEGVVQKSHLDPSGALTGMTVRFTRLDTASKALIDRILAVRGGLGAAASPEPAPAPTAPATPVSTPAPAQVAKAPGPPAGPAASPIAAHAPGPATTAAGEEVVLGIDLGTTNSRVAIVQDGVAHLVSLGPDGRTFAIPSVVALDEKGRFLVGARAKALVLADPANTVYGAKRLMGRRARSRKIRELSKRFAYRIVPDQEGDAGVELRGKVYALPEVAAMLLKELRESVQNLLGHQVSRAVLCVPAYFNDHQRAAMLEAGKLAGLDVLRLVNEPSAVALAFGHGRGLARKRILVYDLGGGTFDASVVELTGDDLEVVTTGGDNFLGGLDFDVRLAQQLASRLPEDVRTRVDDSQLSAQRILDAAEQAKIALSDVESCPVRLPFAIARADGSPVDLDTVATRATLEEVTSDLVERTIEVTLAVLEAGGLKPQGLDEVLLVGGQSRAPLVRRRIEEVLGKKVRADVDPHGAVAVGAAYLGQAILHRALGKPGPSLSEVLSAPIGIGQRGGSMRRVLEKNTRLPAEKTIALPVKAGQPLGVAVFQGTSTVAEENEYLGAINTSSDRAGELTLKFVVSQDGRLDLSAVGPTGKKTEVALTTSDASDDTRAALLAQAPLPGEEAGSQGGLFKGLRKLFGRNEKAK